MNFGSWINLFAVAVLVAPEKNSQPLPRSCYGATSGHHGEFFVWGGSRFCGVDVIKDSKLWSWDGESWKADDGPPIEPRDDALLIQGPGDNELTIFGGRRDGKVFEDVWVRRDGSWRNVTSRGGPGLVQHAAAALDRARGRIVVFGGAVGTVVNKKTYESDGDSWTEYAAPGPAPRIGHGMAWSKQDGGVLLYGGFADQ